MRAKYSSGLFILLLLGCTAARSSKHGDKSIYDYAPSRNHNVQTGNEYDDFEDTSGKEYNTEAREDEGSVERLDLEELLSGTGSALLLRVPEPDAEMLPAHYTRVQSPGVDHMELRTSEVASKIALDEKTGPIEGTKMAVSRISGTSSGRDQALKQSLQGQKGQNLKKYPASKGSVKDLRKSGHAKVTRKKTLEKKSSNGTRDPVTSGSEAESLDRENQRPRDDSKTGYTNDFHKDNYKDGRFYDHENFRDHSQYGENPSGDENHYPSFGNS